MNNKDYKKILIQRVFDLSRKTIALTDKFPKKRSAWVITDQLIRAITSIGANVIEAQAASSNKDFINFLSYALKSGNESKYWLELSKDFKDVSIEEINFLLKETDEIVRILGSSIIKLKRK